MSAPPVASPRPWMSEARAERAEAMLREVRFALLAHRHWQGAMPDHLLRRIEAVLAEVPRG